MYIPYKYDKKKLIQEKKFKKILLPSGFDNNEIQIGRKKFEQCPVSTCELIIDRSQEDNVDAIFFTVTIFILFFTFLISYLDLLLLFILINIIS